MTSERTEGPYKGLARYTFADSNLFAGRDKEIDEFRKILTGGADSLFILHGQSGCGKSSFLEAGVIPNLVSAQAKGQSLLRPVSIQASPGIGPRYVVRGGISPLKALQAAVEALQRQRGRRQFAKTSETSELDEYPSFTLFKSIRSLAKASSERLLFIIDQAEDLFARDGDRQRDEYFRFFSLITNEPAFVKFLVSLRTEFKGRFDDELERHEVNFRNVRNYYLSQIRNEEIENAILRPAAERGISFDPGVPGLIKDDLLKEQEGPILSRLQVICDRLFGRFQANRQREAELAVTEHAKTTITEGDYRAIGAGSTQISSHLDESLIDFLLQSQGDSGKRPAEYADRWKRVLCESLVDRGEHGTRRARPAVSEDDIVKEAVEARCGKLPECCDMLEFLSGPGKHILERPSGDDAGTMQQWKLVHDSLAVSLVEATAEDAVELRYRNELLETASSPGPDESSIDRPVSLKFRTINDMIWDHQIAIYAQYRGFAKDVGMEFEVDPAFDLAGGKISQIDYKQFLKKDSRNDGLKLVVLPSSVFPQIKDKWTTVGITNIYRGYAIIGRRSPNDTGIQPLRAGVPDKINHKLLEQIADKVSAAEVCIHDIGCLEFVRIILKTFGKPTAKLRVTTARARSGNRAQDTIFTALVEKKADFAVGTAPSRGLAEQAGFTVYADFNTVYKVLPSTQQKQFDSLLMHENWAVSSSVSKEDLLRMASVMFRTLDDVRKDPQQFVRFLFGEMHRALHRVPGAYPLQRPLLRSAFANSYVYSSIEDYALDYLDCKSPSFYRSGPGDDPGVLYRKLKDFRRKSDDLLLKLSRRKVAWPPEASRIYRQATFDYRIFNFYDAWGELRKVDSLLASQRQRS